MPAEKASRAGMLISVVRMVAVRALPSFPAASTPAARDWQSPETVETPIDVIL